jgi:uncharacterized repeat protein (TIGR01451 family)
MKVLWRRQCLIFIILLTGIFFLAVIAQAQQENTKLDLKTTAEKEIKVKQGGKTITKRIPLDKASPGDVVIYTITYSNVGKGPVLDAVIVDPVPKGVRYIADTAEGKDAEIMYSTDNGRTWQTPPIEMQIKKPDGSLEKKTVSAERYTHIKWMIKKPVASGQSGRVSFKVTVK